MSLVILKYVTLPWAWMLALWALTSVILGFMSQNTFRKAVCFNLAAIFFAPALFEIYLGLTTLYVPEILTPNPYVKNDLLGYSLKKKDMVVKTIFGPELQWGATYRINGYGQRVSISPRDFLQTSRCIAFFGGSYTFGDGVEDSQTLPSQVQAQLAGKVQCINFGVNGYGPSQVLALLENELEVPSICREPIYGIYQAIPHHISRLAGIAFWDKHDMDPRYVLQEDGTVKHTGTFADFIHLQAQSSLMKMVQKKVTDQFHKSKIATKAFEIYHKKKFSDQDINLFVSVVEKAKRTFEERYPGSRFFVVYWDIHDELTSHTVLQQLEDREIQVVPVGRMLTPRNDGYLSARYRNHPSPKAYELIAEFLVNHVLIDLEARTDVSEHSMSMSKVTRSEHGIVNLLLFGRLRSLNTNNQLSRFPGLRK